MANILDEIASRAFSLPQATPPAAPGGSVSGGGIAIPTGTYPTAYATSTSGTEFDWGGPAGGTIQDLLSKIGNFNIPTNLAPTSTTQQQSTGANTSFGNQQATSQQQSTGVSDASSWQQALSNQIANSLQQSGGQSGIDWNSPLTQAILPGLMSSGQALPGLANQMGDTLQGQYSNLMRQALGPQAFQGTLNQLADRNMLNSSVAGNALAGTASQIAGQVGNQAFQSQLAGQQAQMNVPTSLADLAKLGQQSTQQSLGTSQSTGASESGGGSLSASQQQATSGSQSTGEQGATGTQQQTSQSLNTDPTAAYQAMASFYPSILSALGGVGRESLASSSSQSQNPLSPYELLAQLTIAGMGA